MKKRKISLLQFGLATSGITAGAFSGCAHAAEKIELANSGFENGFEGWSLRDAPDKSYRIAPKPEAFEGNGSAEIVIDANSKPRLRQAAYFARTDFPTAAGYYQLQFAMRTRLTQGEAGPMVIAQGADKKSLMTIQPGSSGIPIGQGNSDWRDISVIYRLPADVKTVVLQLQATNALGSIAIDNVRLTRLDDNTGKTLLNIQSPQAPTLEEAGAKRLDAPCRIINARLGTLYRDPVTGRTNLAINSCTHGQGSGLLVDYQEHKTTVIPFPVGAGGWDLIQTAPDRMLFESLSPLYMIPVDLKTRTVVTEGIKAVPGNNYAWRFSQGPDGWVYMGSYPSAHVYRYHPQTYQVEDLGFMGPEGNLYARNVGVSADGWVLSSMLMEKNCIVAYNIQTKEQIVVADIGPGLNTVGGIVYAALNGELHQFDGSQRKFIPAKLPAPPEESKWTWILQSSTPQRKVVRNNKGVYYVIEEGKPLKPVWNLDLRGGSLVGVDEKDRAVGFRGQHYFVAEPMAQEIKPRLVAENPPPVSIHFLRADPQGGVTGGPSFGQTLFRFDPARNLLQNTPQVVDGGGEVYDGRWVDGKFYFIAYGGGDLAVWDPAQPWDQWNNKNPKLLYTYKGDKDGNQIRPIGGLVVGPQGRLYSGWSAKYGKKGGALGEYDIKTNTARSWQNDVFAPEMAVGSIAADDKYVYGVTSNSFSGIRPAVKPLMFWVFDPIAQKVVFKETIPGATARPAVVRVPETGHIWLASPNGLQRFDRNTLKWAQKLDWPKPAGAPATISASDSRGKTAWFTAGPVVVRLDDDAQPTAHAIFKAPQPVGNMAAGTDGQLYFTQGVDVWSAPQIHVPQK